MHTQSIAQQRAQSERNRQARAHMWQQVRKQNHIREYDEAAHEALVQKFSAGITLGNFAFR